MSTFTTDIFNKRHSLFRNEIVSVIRFAGVGLGGPFVMGYILPLLSLCERPQGADGGRKLCFVFIFCSIVLFYEQDLLRLLYFNLLNIGCHRIRNPWPGCTGQCGPFCPFFISGRPGGRHQPKKRLPAPSLSRLLGFRMRHSTAAKVDLSDFDAAPRCRSYQRSEGLGCVLCDTFAARLRE